MPATVLSKVVVIIGRATSPADVRKLVNLGALAIRDDAFPVIPALGVGMANQLLRVHGITTDEALLDPTLATVPDEAAFWVITDDHGHASTLAARDIHLPWAGWHDRLVEAGLSGLCDFHPRRPRLDRWAGDEDPPIVHADGRFVWPRYDVDGVVERNAEVPLTVAATAFVGFWRDLVATIPELRDYPRGVIADIFSAAIDATQPTPGDAPAHFEDT